jgi:hypothetical protein
MMLTFGIYENIPECPILVATYLNDEMNGLRLYEVRDQQYRLIDTLVVDERDRVWQIQVSSGYVTVVMTEPIRSYFSPKSYPLRFNTNLYRGSLAGFEEIDSILYFAKTIDHMSYFVEISPRYSPLSYSGRFV